MAGTHYAAAQDAVVVYAAGSLRSALTEIVERSARSFGEYDLAFKIDSGASGPKAGWPGDRAVVVFAELEELRRTVQARCRD